MVLEQGPDPWQENAFYFAVVDGSTRIARADAHVERWVAHFRKRTEEPGDTWTNGQAPRSGASSTASVAS